MPGAAARLPTAMTNRFTMIRFPPTHTVRGVEKPCLTQDRGCPQAAKAFGGVHWGDLRNHALDVVALPVPGDRWLLRRGAEAGRSAYGPSGVGGGEECLARDAAGVEAVAAHCATLDRRDPHAKLRGAPGDRQAGSASADDNEIEIRHSRPGAGATEQAVEPGRPGRSAGGLSWAQRAPTGRGCDPCHDVADAGANSDQHEAGG